MDLTLSPPVLVGASNARTQYWFATNMVVVFNATHFLIDARLADDCSDYFCNHTSPSDPSHQISLTTDGGESFVPLWTVSGSSPWSPSVATRPFIGSTTLHLNATTRFSLYQGQVKAPWECPASIFTLHPTLGLSWRLAERPVKFNGVSPVCGSGHMWNQDVVEVDGGGWLLSAQCEESSTQGTNALIFRSFDGYRWDLRSSFPVVSPPGHPVCTSPGENTLVYLANGAGLLLVSRCGDNLPLLGWVSADNGVTWQRFDLPESVRGVMPVAVRTGSGAIVLATGRGGLAMWLNEEGDGKNWTIINIGEAHNRLILHNNKLIHHRIHSL